MGLPRGRARSARPGGAAAPPGAGPTGSRCRARAAGVLRLDRRRVHAHSRRGSQALGAGARRAADPADRQRRGVRAPGARRCLRGGSPRPVPGVEAVLARGGHRAHPAARRGDRSGRRPGARGNVDRHEPPRPAERHGPDRRPLRPRRLRRLRGSGPEERSRQRRRQVPHGGDGHLPDAQRTGTPGQAGVEPEPPRGGLPGRPRPDESQAGSRGRGRRGADHAHRAPRRCGVCGAGHHGRGAEPLGPARLRRRRDGPRRGEQPDRVHHVGL
jgi:hypothetical protein